MIECFIYPTLKNQGAKYLEVTNYILLSFYSFPDWLSEEAEADSVRQATLVDESNDELDSLYAVTVNSPKRLIRRQSSFCCEKRKQLLYFRIRLTFPEEVDKFCYDLWRDKILRIQRDMIYSMPYME